MGLGVSRPRTQGGALEPVDLGVLPVETLEEAPGPVGRRVGASHPLDHEGPTCVSW